MSLKIKPEYRATNKLNTIVYRLVLVVINRIYFSFTSDGPEKVMKMATMSKIPFVEAKYTLLNTWSEYLYKYYCKNCFV